MGFRVWGFWFGGLWGVGFRVAALGFLVRVSGLGLSCAQGVRLSSVGCYVSVCVGSTVETSGYRGCPNTPKSEASNQSP